MPCRLCDRPLAEHTFLDLWDCALITIDQRGAPWVSKQTDEMRAEFERRLTTPLPKEPQ